MTVGRALLFVAALVVWSAFAYAFVFVFAHPYFDVTDGQGRYRIDGVPAGTHALVLWNETIEPETRQVTVPDGGEVEVNYAVAASPAPK